MRLSSKNNNKDLVIFREDLYGSIENKKIFFKTEKHFKVNYYEKNQK